MIVIFLDIDGVLNSGGSADNSGGTADMKNVEALSRLIETTGAVVVLSSGWKLMFDSYIRPITKEAALLNDILRGYGIAIYDKTPDLSTEGIRKARAFSEIKAKEIKAWLSAREDIKSYIVLDDLDLKDDEINSRRIRVNGSAGLSSEDADRAIKMLSDATLAQITSNAIKYQEKNS